MLDRGLALTFRNFATLFFVCAAVTVPLHVAYSVAFKDEIGVRELHAQIESFPPLREVKGVSKHDLDVARIVSGAIALVELALLPLGVKAARRVFDDDGRDGVSTVPAAWRAALTRDYRWDVGALRRRLGVVLSAALLALAVGFCCDRIGALLAEPFSPTYAFTIVGLATALSRAVAAPFFLGPAAYCYVQKKSFAPHAE
ncbi:MAG: hypothetical protein QOF16_1161 [Actinomycetota bacterium]|jgi:hypothetical protein|nr:hypothetical protein [Actinomycetota bacterium]MEA2487507.1 hypothetical protein [Actinomycetota bacterium]